MNWKSYKLGEIIKRKRHKVDIEPDEKYKLVTIKLYHKGVTLRHEALGETIKSNMHLVNTGDFVLSGIDARNGAFGIVPKELDNAVVTNDFWCLVPNDKILRKDFFLFLTSTSFFDYICKQCSDGTTQRIRLQKDKFFDYTIMLPPVEEQAKLVETLALGKSVNTALATELTHQLDLVKQLRQAFLREALQGQLLPQDATDEPARDLLARIQAEKACLVKEKKIKKSKPLPPIDAEEIPFEIPENWVWCRLGEISEVKRGKGPKYAENGIKMMLNQKCVRWYDVEIEHSKLIDEKWYNSLDHTFKIQPDDLLVNSTGDGTIGRSAIADEECEGYIFDSHILRVRGYQNINQMLLCSIINSDYGQNLIQEIKGATSTKQTELGVNNLSNFPIPLPPLAEQQRIVARLDALMESCDALEASIGDSQRHNAQLLQQVLREALEPEEGNT